MSKSKTKTCRICRYVQPTANFHKHCTNKDGLRNECKRCISKRHKEKYSYKKQKNKDLKRLYNISMEQYNELFHAQGGHCAICGKHQSELDKALCVDHNHKTGEVRALLCCICNTQLGIYELHKEKFVKYLKHYG